jgi:PKD repeat protein
MDTFLRKFPIIGSIKSLFFSAFLLGSALHASAQISGDTSVCVGETQVYYAATTPNAIYNWQAVGGNIQGATTNDSLVVNWQTPGSGSVLVSINNAYYTLNVTVHPTPKPKITPYPYATCPPDPNLQGTPNGPDKRDCDKVCKFSTLVYTTPLNAGSTYQWTATGEVSLTGANTNTVTVVWDSTASGSLTVVETNQWGCMDSTTYCVEKVALPVALFTHQANVCLNSTVSFNNLSTGNSLTHQWYFGDGGSSNLIHPTHIYTSPGVYTITLIVTNKCYCVDTFQSTINVNTLPGPDITCPSTVCAFDTASYSTSSAGCTYNWFAIGGTIVGANNLQSVTVAWGAGQLGTLGLVVSGCVGLCSDTTKVYIPIVPATAIINGPVKVCPGECAVYSLPRFSGAKYVWSLNSGACGIIKDSTCCEQVEVCYANLPYSCNDTLSVSYFDSTLNCGGSGVFIIRYRPKLELLGLGEVCLTPNAQLFASNSTICNWSVSPFGPIISPNPSANVSINWLGVPGTYTFTAVPINPNAVCTDSTQRVVKVWPSPQQPVITGDTVVCIGNSVQYCATGVGDIHWQISGGTPSSNIGNCITVTWAGTGPYWVKAYRKSQTPPHCSSDTTTQNIYPTSTLPVPALVSSSPVCANGNSTITTSTVYPAGASYSWSISPSNAGSVTSGQGTNTAQIEWGNNAPQPITISLTVTVCGQTKTSSTVVNLNAAPTPSVVQLSTLCKGGSAQINAIGGVFSSVLWSGAGVVNPTANPATITADGLYQVTVTNTNGCTGLSQINIQYVSGPTASISSADYLTYCIGANINVTICALGNPNYTYAWSNAANTQCINVTSPGSFNVTVTDVTNNCFEVSAPLSVNQVICDSSCVSSQTANITHTGCNPKNFFGTATGTVFGYSWSFGDNTGSNLQNPVHTYTQAGFYLVVMDAFVLADNGIDTCVVRDTVQIEIPLLAKFDFKSGCFGDSVCFTDKSVFTAGNNITSWNWNFGDATTSTSQNPCHLYLAAGTYYPTLTISNGTCVTSIFDTVVINPNPIAAFSFTNSLCINTNVVFTDNSLGSVNHWSWSFGDLGTSLNQNPSHSYFPAAVYPVKLMVKDIYGCKDSITQNITISNPSISGNINAYPDTIVCAGTNVLLVAPPCGTCTYAWSNGSTNDSITVNTTGLYVVNITDANGCKYSTFIKIIVHPKPTPIIVGNGTKVCVGSFVNLQTTDNPNWLYQWISNEPAINGTTTFYSSASATTPGTYTSYVVVTDTSTGCSDTSLAYVYVVTAPPVAAVITAIGATTVCKGDTITLFATHPDPTVTLQWSTGEIADTIQVTENGCYFVNATDTNGCVTKTIFCVTVNPMPELCEFYEGCMDTCAPYTIKGPLGGTSYQWLNNGVPLPGDTLQNYTASVSGNYSVIVTNSFGCFDTTGVLNLTLYPCDSQCVEFVIDSIYCDSTGVYVLLYHVTNHSPNTAHEIGLQILAPHLNVAYAPNLITDTLASGATSQQLSATIYNGHAGDTLCFQTYLYEYFHDTTGGQCCKKLCCKSDTLCVTLPPCEQDTACCYFDYVRDSIYCVTKPNGQKEYHFSVTIDGCGTLNISPNSPGTINLSNPYTLPGGIVTISGVFVPANNTVTSLCLLYVMFGNNKYCADTTICMKLPPCPPPGKPCEWEYRREICAGQSSTFWHLVNQAGTTYTWLFAGGSPATATGVGPHAVQYNTPGTYAVQLTMTNATGTTTCIDSIKVVAPPVASITQSGNSLFAQPAGMSYQWYMGNPGPAGLLAGETNQFINPLYDKMYCVVVTNYLGCKDTACRDFVPTGIEDLSAFVTFSLFPNPAAEIVNVAVNSVKATEAKEINVYDMNGKLLQSIVSANDVTTLNISTLAKGVYTIEVKVGKIGERKRFTKL